MCRLSEDGGVEPKHVAATKIYCVVMHIRLYLLLLEENNCFEIQTMYKNQRMVPSASRVPS